jgi:hypothetical protein
MLVAEHLKVDPETGKSRSNGKKHLIYLALQWRKQLEDDPNESEWVFSRVRFPAG